MIYGGGREKIQFFCKQFFSYSVDPKHHHSKIRNTTKVKSSSRSLIYACDGIFLLMWVDNVSFTTVPLHWLGTAVRKALQVSQPIFDLTFEVVGSTLMPNPGKLNTC